MPGTVTLAQIAQLAQVQRPSVSNWRRRHDDFPRPVGGTATQPLFDTDQIAGWLDVRPGVYGEIFRENLRRSAAPDTIMRDPDAYAETGLALIALRAAHGRPLPTDPTSLAEVIDKVDAAHPGLFPAIDISPSLCAEVERLVEAHGPAGAAESILATATRHGWTDASAQTPPEICELVLRLTAELLGELTNLTIADLAAGPGRFLTTVPASSRPVRHSETDPARLRLLRLRLFCHGHRPSEAEPAGADLVFADPPFQPGEQAGDHNHPLSWATRVVESLHEDGHGFVVVPEWTLTRTAITGRLPVERAREDLIRHGHVRGIIQLPRRIHPYLGGADLALLMLAADGTIPRELTLCDADQARVRYGPAWLERTVELMTGPPSRREDSRLCQAVPVTRLLARRSLLPAHVLVPESPPDDHVAEAVNARATAARLCREATDPATILDRLEITPHRGGVTYRTLGALLRAGQLRRLAGHRIPGSDLGSIGQRALGREELLGEIPIGVRRIDLAALAGYPAAAVTDPGDVILLVGEQLRIIVDDHGGSVLLTPVQGLRIPGQVKHTSLARDEPQRPWIGPYALAALLGADRNLARIGGRMRRVSLDQLEVPLLPSADYQQFDDAARDLAELAEQARAQAAALEAARHRLATGLTAGALKLRLKPST